MKSFLPLAALQEIGASVEDWDPDALVTNP
jgi:hypothetical protein